MAEVEPQTGAGERENSASCYYPEEWPEEFVSHGARGDGDVALWGEVNFAFYQGRSGVECKSLVLHLLVARQENGFVGRAKVKTTLSIKTLRPFVRFVDEKADRFRIFKQTSHQLRHEMSAGVLLAPVFSQPNSFEVNNLGSF